MKNKINEITQKDALTFFPHLDESGKKLFRERYKDFFLISGYAEACKKSGLNPQQELPYTSAETKRQKKINAYAQLDVIRESIGNHPGINETKWYPVFKVTPSGLVFSDTFYENWDTSSYALVGAPFVFKSSEEASDFGQTNEALYNEIFTR